MCETLQPAAQLEMRDGWPDKLMQHAKLPLFPQKLVRAISPWWCQLNGQLLATPATQVIVFSSQSGLTPTRVSSVLSLSIALSIETSDTSV